MIVRCEMTMSVPRKLASRPVGGRADEAGECLLFTRFTPIFFQLQVTAAEVHNPLVEQSDRIKSPSIANEACKVTMAYMHCKSFGCEILSDFSISSCIFRPLAKIRHKFVSRARPLVGQSVH